MALISKPTKDPKVTRWWWRTLRTWVYALVDPLWEAFRGENSGDIAFTNVTSINGISITELETLNGLTATTAELNLLSGLTANAAELNKADRTQSDGVAEASKNVVLDANGDLLGKRYDINRSLMNVIVGGKPFLRFDGVDDFVSKSNDANLNFGANTDFSLEEIIKTTNAGQQAIVNKGATGSGGARWMLRMDSNPSGTVRFEIDDSTTQKNPESTTTVHDGEWHHIVATADRDGSASIYIDGGPAEGTTDISSVGDIDDVSKSLAIGILSNDLSSIPFDGDIALVRIWNRALTADEIKALASGASVGFADRGAGQADLVANGDDWTGASGSTPPTSWSESGAGTATYIIRDNSPVANFDDDKALEIVVSGNSKTLSQSLATAGKRYRVAFVYRNLDGSSSSYVALGSSANSVNLQNSGISGDGIVFEQEFVSDGADLLFFVDSGGTLQIDHVTVVQIGCVADWSPGAISAVQWQDNSGNELHGAVTGAVPINLPVNHLAHYSKKSISGDSTLTGVIPAGYRISSIIVQETAGNAITGGLKIGSSAGGTDVVNGQAVGASALVDCTLDSRLFSLTAAQSLYVEDVTAWNGASIDLYLEMERIK